MNVSKEDVQALISWTKSAKVLYASESGRGINKRLFVTVSGSYEVYDKDELVMSTTIPGKAIKSYNEIEATDKPASK